MGLCKCPKKSVTNQFCFEHRVNVCEHCMVTNHTKCVVLSYLLWLRDSDYDATCHFCKTDLAEGDCVRLICYHVFHWKCLNKYACDLPPNTAPAGYVCPICKIEIFPEPNMASPVAETLRNALLGVKWARCGLTFPIVDENVSSNHSYENNSIDSSSKLLPSVSQAVDRSIQNKLLEVDVHTLSQNYSQHSDRRSRPEPYGAQLATGHYAGPRKTYASPEVSGCSHLKPLLVDHDDNKYKRRSALEWFSRWFQSRTFLGGTRRRDPNVLYKKWVVIAMLAIIAICTLVILFLRMGRASADGDPLLDPHFNPNIRVQDRENDLLPNAAGEVHKDSPVLLPR